MVGIRFGGSRDKLLTLWITTPPNNAAHESNELAKIAQKSTPPTNGSHYFRKWSNLSEWEAGKPTIASGKSKNNPKPAFLPPVEPTITGWTQCDRGWLRKLWSERHWILRRTWFRKWSERQWKGLVLKRVRGFESPVTVLSYLNKIRLQK